MSEEHGHGVAVNADRRWLWIALGLIAAFMAVEVVVGLLAGSLALLSDAGHMLTDAVAIGLALIAIRWAARPAKGRFTYGFTRAEILSAQANGATLLLLAVYFFGEGTHRLISPPPVEGVLVFTVGLVGIAVNLAATWSLSKANRTSLNIQGAYVHILNDLLAFITTAIAGVLVWVAGFARADAVAALVVAVLMAKAGWGLVRESGTVFLEAAPAELDPDVIGEQMVGMPRVVEVHDLHIWQITSGQPALSAHVLVRSGVDCHTVRGELETTLHDDHGVEHTTLQVDHADAEGHAAGGEHCQDAHGTVHRSTGGEAD